MILETFINGIEVLDKTEIKEPTVIGGIIALVVFVLLVIVWLKIDDESLFCGFVSVFVALLVFFAIQKPTGEYKYKVTIDDTVSLTEFTEKYEITDQEGKIYTIRLKESE